MPADQFVEWKVITDVDGVVIAVITYRSKPNGERLYSYSFMRSFDDNGVIRRTPWLNSRHASAVSRLLPIVVSEIEREQKRRPEK